MNFDNIPAELRNLKQWCCFDLEDGKKIPYIAGNCAKASSNNPETWRTFEEAAWDVTTGKRQHLGLAITHPYVFVDLDEPQPGIFDTIESYSQRSQSGNGTHIICRSHFEGEGIHPKSPAVGMFKESRFCLFTADVVEGRNEIKDFDSETLQQIYDWLSSSKQSYNTTNLVEVPVTLEDEEVLERCRKRFDTFDSLWNGNAGEDHSASDHALISALADECESNEQVTRLWFSSPLCRPHRRNQKYVDMTLKKIRGKQQFFKLHEFQKDDEQESEEQTFTYRDLGERDLIDSLPDGLVKRLADWHWRQSFYPLQECSFAVAVSVIATVAGRNFQSFTGMGLNPWFILLADTSWGKDEYAKGITKIFSTITKAQLGVGFMGMVAGIAASGEGLEDRLARSERLNTYCDEFDFIFQSLASQNAQPHIKSLTKLLLTAYGRSGQGSFLERRLKASKGPDEPQPQSIEAPNLVVSGETIAEKLYRHMTSELANNGFLQRFCILRSKNTSVSKKINPTHNIKMPQELVDDLLSLFVHCDELKTREDFITVKPQKDAEALLHDYVDRKREESLNANEDATKHLMNRAGLKVIKLSGLFGVSAGHKKPVVTVEQVEAAMRIVDRCDKEILDQFNNGSVGGGQTKQESEIREILKTVLKAGKATRIKLGINGKLAGVKDAVPYLWLKRKVISSNAFSSDRNGASDAFEKALRHMETGGEIIRIRAEEAETKYGVGCGAVIGIK